MAESHVYMILGKYDLNNLNIQVNTAINTEISITKDGVKIKFIANGFGNPVVPSDFKIKIQKELIFWGNIGWN